LHSMSPRAVADVEPAVRALAGALGKPPPEPFALPSARPLHATGFVATWRRPYMTLNHDTYASSLLEHLGLANVCAHAPARYPEVELADIPTPDLVVLPDEPYPFAARHVPEVQQALPQSRVLLVDGRDLFWWGIRTPAALERLAVALSR